MRVVMLPVRAMCVRFPRCPQPPLSIYMTNVLPRRSTARLGAAFRGSTRHVPGNTALPHLPKRLTTHFIPRLTATAVFAYLLASLLPGSSRPVLAPLTAILVIQATRYQTMRSAVQRVASVVAGVVVALGFTAAMGFTWWSLGLVIAIALMIGSVLRLGGHILEVPISAMLILSLGSGSAATGRVVDTLAGAAAGLVGGMIFSPVRTQPAEDSLGEFSRRMAGLLEDIASGLTGTGAGETETWLARARSLTTEIQQLDDTVGEAEDSLRLTPRALRSDRTTVLLRNGLEGLEIAAATVRGLARSLTDDARLPKGEAAAHPDTPDILARVLRRLAEAARAYGDLIRADLGEAQGLDSNELERHLAEAREQRDLLALMLHHAPEPASASWRLRGEILVHVDRLTSELQTERLSRARQDEGRSSWPWAVRPAPRRLASVRG